MTLRAATVLKQSMNVRHDATIQLTWTDGTEVLDVETVRADELDGLLTIRAACSGYVSGWIEPRWEGRPVDRVAYRLVVLDGVLGDGELCGCDRCVPGVTE